MLDKHLRVLTAPAALESNTVYFGDFRVTVLADRLFRIEKDGTKHFTDEATQTVLFRNMPKNEYSVEADREQLAVRTKKATLCLKEKLEDSYVVTENGTRVSLEDRENLLGTYRTLDRCNGDKLTDGYGDTLHETPIRLEKGVLAKNGVAVLDDSDSVLIDKNGLFKERTIAETDLYVFAFGHDYRGALKALYEICGATPLIPRFALGNWWSRYHAYTQKEYVHLMENFKKSDIPFTVATVDMDWHWSETLDQRKNISKDGKNDEFHGWANGWTGYSWNTDLFPDHKAFLNKLHEMGLRVTLNLHPADGVRYFEDQYEDMACAMGEDPKSEKQIPFDITDEKFINAYFKVLHKPYEREGVDFWWIDWQQGNNTKIKGLDPLVALNHYHYLDNGKDHQALILSRYSGIGSHRYPLGFSGDTHVTWDTMAYLPYFTANASNAGYTWWSHDIGGHMCGYKDNELNVRFIQFGVFSPINRLHCSNSITFTKEPYAYKNGTGKIIEEFLRFRHRLIPFLYSAAYETHVNGTPLIEPMYYDHPEEEEAYRARDQYMFGGSLLVAPVIRKSEGYGMSETKVWLPAGKWTDIFTGDEYEGGRTINAVRYIDSIPVFAKAGSVLVLDGREHTNASDPPEETEIRIFNGDGSYVLHEDDCGARYDTSFILRQTGNVQKLFLRASEEKDGAYRKNRSFELRFMNIETGSVKCKKNGEDTEVESDDNGCLSVLLKDVKAGDEFELVVDFEIDEEKKQTDRLLREITFLECEDRLKNELSRQLCENRSEDRRRIISEADIPEIFKRRLLENI